jgi:hypothetical protein
MPPSNSARRHRPHRAAESASGNELKDKHGKNRDNEEESQEVVLPQ